jgi:phosphatidylglycerophosphatase A
METKQESSGPDADFHDSLPTLPSWHEEAQLRLIRPNGRFLLSHPAHLLALGLGSGLSPKAPGTVGTLWAWASFLVLQPWISETGWALLLAIALPLAWWAGALTAKHLRNSDPSSVVIDEVVAFWLVLWLLMPANIWEQLAAFVLFRFFDAVKPGPVGWADRLYERLKPAQVRWGWAKIGWGILLDDLVAAFCTLMLLALWRYLF